MPHLDTLHWEWPRSHNLAHELCAVLYALEVSDLTGDNKAGTPIPHATAEETKAARAPTELAQITPPPRALSSTQS